LLGTELEASYPILGCVVLMLRHSVSRLAADRR
jgi:hypothetical protein